MISKLPGLANQNQPRNHTQTSNHQKENLNLVLQWCPKCKGPVILEIPPFVKTVTWACPYCKVAVAQMLTKGGSL